VITASIFTRSCFSVVRNTTSRPTGTISAPPIPCSTRAATKVSRLGARPQSHDARVNRPMAPANTFRAPKRSTTQPLSGMNTATASK
jgi:hypothetical protein